MKDIKIEAAETVSLFCRLNQRVKKELPIRSSEMGLLILLVTSKERISSVEAAQFFRVSKPVITAMVKTLTAKGYLRKEPQSHDRRSFLLIPETEGSGFSHRDIRRLFVYNDYPAGNPWGEEAFEDMIRLLATGKCRYSKGGGQKKW